MIKRYMAGQINEDLKEKMVFISGPRQVGKTTLAKQIGNEHFMDSVAYLNWDKKADRKKIVADTLPADKKLIIFDEIHKYRKWKNYIKGEYDKHKDDFKIMVTGSARLDLFRKGGDSLLGRYHFYRLHPLSVAELLGKRQNGVPFKGLVFTNDLKESQKVFNRLFKYGGFPEIYLAQNERILRRWHNERVDRVIKEDIRDVENIRDISSLQIMVELLPQKIGSLLSLNSLREDLEVTHKTISMWADVLEKFYYYYRIYPFQNRLIKSLRKEPKAYLWDWSEITDEGIKFENIIASHLLKYCDFLYDYEGHKAKLYYLRDKEQREVDFLVCINNRPWFCVETKTSPRDISKGLGYFSSKIKIPFLYEVVKEEGIDFYNDNIRVISAAKFLTALI